MEILRNVRGFISSFFQHEKCSLVLPLSIGIKLVNFGWAHTKLHSCQVGCMAMFVLKMNHAINQVLHTLPQIAQKGSLYHTHLLLFLFLNGPNKPSQCTPLLPCIWKKTKYFKQTNILVMSSLTCQAHADVCHSFSHSKMHKAWPQNIPKCNLSHHFSFLHKLPIMPPTILSHWQASHLITDTKYKW